MSLFELGDSDGSVSLRELLGGHPPRASGAGLTLQRLAEVAVRGGWPANLGLSADEALQANVAYLEEVIRVDVNRVDGVRRDPLKVARVVASIARNVATEAAVSTIAKDAADDDDAVTRKAVYSYLEALGRLMVTEDVPAWAPRIRSRARLRETPTRHLVDPSLCLASLRVGPRRLYGDLRFFGLVFESLVVRDLRVYSQGCGGTVFHYRDSNDLEVDAIVECAGGRWAAFEVKLGGEDRVEEAADSLRRFLDVVDTSECGPPSAVAVITGTGEYSYMRPDGVTVVPITQLGP